MTSDPMEGLRDRLDAEPGPSADFSARVMARIRQEKGYRDSRTSTRRQRSAPWLVRFPVRAAAAVLILAGGVWGWAWWLEQNRAEKTADPSGTVARLDPEAVAGGDIDMGDVEAAAPPGRETEGQPSGLDLGKRAGRLRRNLGKMIELQDPDGSWTRLPAEGLPLDATGLSAMAFKVFLRLGGRDSHPEQGDRALEYLLRRQREDGSFSPSLLTTAVVVNVLQEAAGPGEKARGISEYIARGKKFLRRHRNAEGVWSSETGNERDDLLATVFAVRALGDEAKVREAASFLGEKTESLLDEARRGGNGDLSTRIALCLAARVSLGEEPSEEAIQSAARVLLHRLDGTPDAPGLPFEGMLARRGEDYWTRCVERMAGLDGGPPGEGTEGPADLFEVLSLALLADGKG